MSTSPLQRVLDDAVAEGIVPCAILSVVTPQKPARRYLAGCHTHQAGPLLREQDLFDLASLSKVVATTAVLMRLFDEGHLELDAPLQRYLPDFAAACPAPEQRGWRDTLSIRQLLAHCSGFAAGYPFHSRHAQISDPAEQRALLLAQPLQAAPGSVTLYSDLGFMLLGEAVRAITGKNLATVAQELVFAPLGMASARFKPSAAQRGHCVPTELIAPDDSSDTGTAWQGVVHDENARWFGGIAGHAGLFASSEDLERFARCLLAEGAPLFAPSTVRLFTQPAALVSGSSRCLGWDGPSANCVGGTHISSWSFGHTGFTGTSMWIDPPQKRAIILLTNAVHPRRSCKERGYYLWRNHVHSAAYE
jgi:CubicO group peptidase (beta-lactamase class C family)